MMKRLQELIVKIAWWTAMAMSTIMIVFVTVLVFRYRFDEITSNSYSDSVFLCMAALLGFLLISFLLGKLFERLHRRFRFLDKLLLLATIAFSCGFSWNFVGGQKYYPPQTVSRFLRLQFGCLWEICALSCRKALICLCGPFRQA